MNERKDVLEDEGAAIFPAPLSSSNAGDNVHSPIHPVIQSAINSSTNARMMGGVERKNAMPGNGDLAEGLPIRPEQVAVEMKPTTNSRRASVRASITNIAKLDNLAERAKTQVRKILVVFLIIFLKRFH